MPSALRFIAAVIAGLFTAFVLVVAIEIFSAVVHPVPEDFAGTPEELAAHVKRYPSWILAVCGLGWGLTAVLATGVARRMAGRPAGVVIGVLLVLGVVMNIVMLPYVIWFKASIVPMVAGGAFLGLGRRPSQPSSKS